MIDCFSELHYCFPLPRKDSVVGLTVAVVSFFVTLFSLRLVFVNLLKLSVLLADYVEETDCLTNYLLGSVVSTFIAHVC